MALTGEAKRAYQRRYMPVYMRKYRKRKKVEKAKNGKD